MKLSEARELFRQKHPEESSILSSGSTNPNFEYASCVWYGFKSALIILGKLECEHL